MSDGRAPSPHVVEEIEEGELRPWVEHCLGARVDGFERRALPEESASFACELLTVRTGGRTVELLFKDTGRRKLPREDDTGARREIEVYRHILDPELLGTARHVGSRLEAEDGRSWLLLERVRGARIAEQGFEYMLAAAAWLGRLQGHAAARGIVAAPPAALAVHDLPYLLSTAEEAVRLVASVDGRMEQDLRDALDGYEEGLEQLCEQPRTLVHGSFLPEEVLVDPAATPPRVLPIVWEHAAQGSALFDVAFLANGLEREQRLQLLRVHREAAAESGVHLPEAHETRELVTIVRQHCSLRALGGALRRGVERKRVESLIALISNMRLDMSELRKVRGRVPSSGALPSLDPEPALSAWRSLGREERVTGVEPLAGTPSGRKGRRVYRLRLDGGRCASLIAKWSRRATRFTEHFVYTDLLPRLPVTKPSCEGWVELDGESWMFLEDAGTIRCTREDPAHRVRAASWLGALHRAGTSLERDARVPSRGPRWFLASLMQSREAILAALSNPAVAPVDHRRLREVAEQCARVAARWGLLEEACAAMPTTLVHSDFQPKNVYLRPGADGPTLMPIDWEYVSWSVPGLDLGTFLRKGYTDAELAAYCAASGCEAAPLPTWISVGCALRAVFAIQWASKDLALPFPEEALRNLPLFGADLERAFEELGA